MDNYLNGKMACAYIRVSSNDQTEYSPDSQIKLIKKYAKDNQIDLLTEYIYQENGISGGESENRPVFQKMINDAKIKPKPFDIILVYDFSRFARNKEESVIYKAKLRKKYDIDIISITQPLTFGKERIILESMYEAMDEYYLENLSENIKRGRNEKASRGEWNGRAPYGYEYNKESKSLNVLANEASIINVIADMFIELKKLKPIANKLNMDNIKTKTGKQWEDRAINSILNNITYIGKLRDGNGLIHKAKHKPILSNNKWDKVQEIMEARKITNYKYQKNSKTQDHWLRGLLVCSKCGSHLCLNKAREGNNPLYFQCSNYSKSKCKESHYVVLSKIEAAILEEIENTFTNKISINVLYSNSFENEKVKFLIHKQNKINDRLERIKIAYQDGIDSLAEYKTNKTDLLKEKAEIEQEIKKINIDKSKENKKENIYKECKKFFDVLTKKNIDMNARTYLSHLLFDKIIYNKKNNEITIHYK